MNLLLDILPETEAIGGREYFMDCNFRTCIILEKILKSNCSSRRKVLESIDLFFPDEKPSDIIAATDAILRVYRCGDNDKPDKKAAVSPCGVRNGRLLIQLRTFYVSVN